MALSFANQLLSILFLSKNHHSLENKVYNVPHEIDQKVARYAIEAENLRIDDG
jgi:adenosylhomocysteinase